MFRKLNRKIKSLVAILLLISLPFSTFAATITVDNLNDDNVINGNCELREAITSANRNLPVDNCASGEAAPVVDNINFSTGPGTITLNNGVLPAITDPVTIDGGDTNLDNVPDITIDAGGTSRVFDVQSATTLSNLGVLNGATTGATPDDEDGGSIIVRSGQTLNTDHTVIVNSSADNNGGAIATEDGATLNLNQGTIIQGEAANSGGGIYLGDNSTLNANGQDDALNSVSIINSRAHNTNGGGIATGTHTHLHATHLNMAGSRTLNTDFPGGDGGSIALGDNSDMDLHNSKIFDSAATGNGGAISLGESVVVNLFNTVIGEADGRQIHSDQNGGAISVGDESSVSTTDTSIFSPTADNDGGAIYLSNTGSLTMNGSAPDLSLIKNANASNGGAIFIDIFLCPRGTDPSLCGGTITSTSPNNVSLTNTTLDSNSASDTGGGAIYASDGSKINLVSSKIINSTAPTGGGIFVPGRGIVRLPPPGPGCDPGVCPPALPTGRGNLINLTDSTFDSDQATDDSGGGIYIAGPGTLTATNLTMTNNLASNSGGAIYFDGQGGGGLRGGPIPIGGTQDLSALGQTTITTGDFENNHANNSGGAIALTGGTHNYSNLTMTDNQAPPVDCIGCRGLGGGAISSEEDAVTVSNSTFTGNQSTDGGAISSDNSNFTINNSVFDNNAATDIGMAILASADTGCRVDPCPPPVTWLFKMLNVEFKNHVGANGMMFFGGTQINFDGLNIHDNNISDGSSVISVKNGSDTSTDSSPYNVIQNSTFQNNDNTDLGDGNNFVNILTDNISLNKDNFFLNHSDESLLSIFAHNSALIDGLNIGGQTALPQQNQYAVGLDLQAHNYTVDHSNFTNNTGTKIGGFIAYSDGLGTFRNSSVTGNTGDEIGGIGLAGNSATYNVTISGNQSPAIGGMALAGIADNIDGDPVDAASVASVINSTIAYNQATVDQAGAAPNAGGLMEIGNASTDIGGAPITVNVGNTILSNNIGTGSSGVDCGNFGADGSFVSQGNNLISDLTNCDFSPVTSDITGVTAQLDPALALNGGTTLSHLLFLSSPAIDAGNDSFAPSTDQRALSRPQNLHADIGAIEDDFPPIISLITPIPPQTSNQQPTFVFTTNEAGTITYGGSCSGLNNAATQGSNIDAYTQLVPGLYSDCTITVTDSTGNVSNVLHIPPFQILSGVGHVGTFGQGSCSGPDCNSQPSTSGNGTSGNGQNPPTSGNPPFHLPVITEPNNPPTTPTSPTIPTPGNPNPSNPSTPSNPSGTSGGTTSGGTGGTNGNPPGNNLPSSNLPPVTTTPETTPTTTEITPPGTENPTHPSALENLSNDSVTITTPEANQISADDTPFVMGGAPANSGVDLYVFESSDFDTIRNEISDLIKKENASDPSRASLSAGQLQAEFEQRFTNAVVTILQKYLNNTLDANNPDEAKFIGRVLELGQANSTENKLFILDSDKSLRDSQYLVLGKSIQNGLNIFSKEVPFTIDSSLNILTPEVDSLGNKPITNDALISGLHVEVDPGNYTPTLVGKIVQPSKIVANWQSDIQTSALIADTLDQQFRLSPPNPLEPGDHTVYVTAYRRSDNAQSKTLKINFKISAALPQNNSLWYLAGGLLAGLILGTAGTAIYFRRKNKSKLPPKPPVAPSGPTPAPTPSPSSPATSTFSSTHTPPVQPSTIFPPKIPTPPTPSNPPTSQTSVAPTPSTPPTPPTPSTSPLPPTPAAPSAPPTPPADPSGY